MTEKGKPNIKDGVGRFQTEDEKDDAGTKCMEMCIEQLKRHYSSCRIIATSVNSKDQTSIQTRGFGDAFSQIGASQQWLARQDEIVRIHTQGERDSLGETQE